MQRIKLGFTLAEVLITLGVIGVIAAMTLPTLIQNYQKHVWVNQLKKSVSTIEKGFKMAMAEDGVESLENTELMLSLNGENAGHVMDDFSNKLKRYFKIINYRECEYQAIYQLKSLDGSLDDHYGDCDDGMITYYLAGGIIFDIDTNGNSRGNFNNKNIANISVDVNAEKGPNQYGRDVFNFSLTDKGSLQPNGGQYIALSFSSEDISSNRFYWKNSSEACGVANSSNIPNGTKGYGCAGRIMENGWKMDY